MEVDLSKARKGDKVRFKCGGEAELTHDAEGWGAGFNISFAGRYKWLYWSNGYLDGAQEHEPFHIVALIQKEFDWSTVRPGMAFMGPITAGHVIYVGPSQRTNGRGVPLVVCEETWKRPDDPGLFGLYHRGKLTRAPEHDIEVQG